MKKIVYYLAMHVVQIYGSDHLPCLEPQLIVKETYCHSSNTSERTMQVITDELSSAANFTKAVLANDDCSLTKFDTHFEITDTFYIECEVENIDCLEDTSVAGNNTFIVECEAPDTRTYVVQDILGKQSKYINTDRIDTTEENGPSMIVILVSSLAGGAAAAAIGFGIYKLKTIMQSRSYILPPEMA